MSLQKTSFWLLIHAFGIAFTFFMAQFGLLAGLGMLAIPIAGIFLFYLFTYPVLGLYSAMVMGFIANGLARYVSVPFGLAIDGILVLTYLAIYLKKQSYDWSHAKNGLVLVSFIWLLYSVFELLNPESPSFEAWFYAMRGVSLYMFLSIPLALVLLKKPDHFLHIWLFFSLMGTLWGAKQQWIDLDSFETAWLNAGAAKQHIIFGKLRVFSFYSDAGQFGASQAHTGVVSLILFLTKGLKGAKKWFYFVCFVASVYGMMISGTRGALAVPAIGLLTYLLFSKKIKVFVLGLVLLGGVFVFLKYTKIAQGVYAVNRMRTALDPNDASLLVRLENQRKLSIYLANRPFGGGIGSAGNWGLRFSPNSFLAQTPTDSWFVRIWAELGVVGLSLHLIILLYISLHAGIVLWKMPESALRQQRLAIFSGMLGIFVASYGNGILGQMPTGILMYLGWAFLFFKK